MISQNEEKQKQLSTTVHRFFKTFTKRRDGSIASFKNM